MLVSATIIRTPGIPNFNHQMNPAFLNDVAAISAASSSLEACSGLEP